MRGMIGTWCLFVPTLAVVNSTDVTIGRGHVRVLRSGHARVDLKRPVVIIWRLFIFSLALVNIAYVTVRGGYVRCSWPYGQVHLERFLVMNKRTRPRPIII